MELYIKQRVFTWGDRFSVYDALEREQFYVEGEVFSFGKKLHLYDLNGQELAYIQQKVWSFLPKFHIFRDGSEIAEVVREIALFQQWYTVHGLGWEVEGDFSGHEYTIRNGDQPVAFVSKKWFTWGDTYQIVIQPGADAVAALAVVLVIDACIEMAQNN